MNIDVEQYLKEKNFRVFQESTLFPPNWEALKQKRCPLCENKLKVTKNKKLAICSGKKHKKPFVITAETFYKLAPQNSYPHPTAWLL